MNPIKPNGTARVEEDRAIDAGNIVSIPDGHDGHGAYLSEIRNSVDARSYKRSAHWIGLFISLSCAFWVLFIFENDFENRLLPVALVFSVAVPWISFRQLVAGMPTRREKRLMIGAGAGLIAITFATYVLAHFDFHLWRSVDSTVTPQAQERAEMSRWRDDIEKAGSHGALGMEPSMLEVTDYGSEVSVRNISRLSIECLKISRVRIDDGSGTIVSRCEMQFAKSNGSCVVLPANEKDLVKFSLVSSASDDCTRLPLSYQVGGPKVAGPAWWSDPELQTLEEDLKAASLIAESLASKSPK